MPARQRTPGTRKTVTESGGSSAVKASPPAKSTDVVFVAYFAGSEIVFTPSLSPASVSAVTLPAG